MPANEKVTATQIMQALLLWKGNVSGAAESLGLSWNGLDKRIRSLGIAREVEAMRRMVGTTVKVGKVFPTIGKSTPSPKRAALNSTRAASRPIVQSMSAAAPAVQFPERHRRPNVRIRPDHIDRLVEARFDLIAALRMEVSEQDILNRCLDECLKGWLDSQVAAARGEGPADDDAANRG